MKKTLVIFVLFILSIFTNLTIEKSYGRKPAVLPVSGISIDDIEPVTEEQAKGYEFKNELTKSEEVFKRNPSQLDMQVTTETRSEVLPALILFLILLPIGLWISVMKAKKVAPKVTSAEVDNNQVVAQVVDIKSRQEVAKLKTKENLDENKDKQLPKAS
jgi:hypothetical protein